MIKYTLKRLFQSLITVILIVSVVFLLLRLLPVEFYFSESDWLEIQKQDLKYLKTLETERYKELVASFEDPELDAKFSQDIWLTIQKAAVESENEQIFVQKITALQLPENERFKLLSAGFEDPELVNKFKQTQWLSIQKAAVESENKAAFAEKMTALELKDTLLDEEWSMIYEKAREIKATPYYKNLLTDDMWSKIYVKAREIKQANLYKEDLTRQNAELDRLGLRDPAFVQLYRFFKNNLFKSAYEPHYFSKVFVAEGNNHELKVELLKSKYAENVKAEDIEIKSVFDDPMKDYFTKDEKKTLSEEEKLERLSRYGYEEGKPLTQTIKAVEGGVKVENGATVVLTLDGPVIEKANYQIRIGSYYSEFKIRSYGREATMAPENEKTDSKWEELINTKVSLSFGSPSRMKTMANNPTDDVYDIIKSRMMNSFRIGIIALGIALIIGVPMGILQATFKDKVFDYVGQTYTILINAVPSIVVYFLILIVGAKTFNLPFFYTVGDWKSMIMPVFCLSLGSSASYMLWMRRYMVDELNKDYIRLAKLKGMKTLTIMRKHVMKNAFLPLAQYLPYSVLLTVGGSLLVERVFSVDGLGKVLTDSITKCDTNMVLAIVSLYAALGIIGLFLGDVFMIILDPRIRLTGKGGTR